MSTTTTKTSCTTFNGVHRLAVVLTIGLFVAVQVFLSQQAMWRILATTTAPTFITTSGVVVPADGASAVSQQQQRLLKYFQTYRYVLPASRYDYHPVPAKECGVGNFEDFFKLKLDQRSRLDEDKFIYQTFFQNRSLVTVPTSTTGHDNRTTSGAAVDATTQGTYVELGAFDGQRESNTRFFDVCLGWKGLLIEGNPESFEKVISHRPFAHKMSLAPSCSADYERVNKTVSFYRYPMTNVGLVDRAITYQGKPTVDVPCGPLGPILLDVFGGATAAAAAGDPPAVAEILFFSLDVEGAERLVLDTIDFTQRLFIHVFMIEVVNDNCPAGTHCQVRQDVRQRMQEVGYLRYEGLVHASDIYVHPDSPFQMPAHVGRPAARRL
jgi:hypothetical protein